MKVEIVSESGEIQHPKIQHIKDTEEELAFRASLTDIQAEGNIWAASPTVEPLPYAEQVKLAIERMRK